jgi:predicted phage terminase large subunit-like protein
VVSVDSAFTEKEENDPTGCTTWGIWVDPTDGYPKVMLIMAWRKHLPIHGEDQDPQERGESDADYAARCMPGWGIVEYVAWNCRRFGGADVLLVEAKANGLDVIREMQRLYGHEKWGVVKIVPKTDKVARALSVQPAFAQHIVHAPDRDFARMVQDEMAMFPKGRFKDLTDSATQALRWMREQGLLQRRDEIVRRVLLVEAKASGLDVIREMQRLYGHEKWGVVKIVPKTDKVSRALSVQPAFAQHIVHAPDRDFVRMVQDEMAMFPKGRFKDLTDSATQALRWMREQGLLQRRDEIVRREEEAKDHGVIQRRRRGPIYRA